MKDTVNYCKAKSLLEKALNQNDTYLPAVYLLAQVYEEVIFCNINVLTLLPQCLTIFIFSQEISLEQAINLLQKQVNKNPTAKLHQMLGDLYARSGEDEKAFHHYHVALR